MDDDRDIVERAQAKLDSEEARGFHSYRLSGLIDLLTEALSSITSLRDRLAGQVCSVCVGSGDPGTGHACICGGLGTLQAEADGLREECVRLREALIVEVEGQAEAMAVVLSVEGTVDRLRAERDAWVRWDRWRHHGGARPPHPTRGPVPLVQPTPEQAERFSRDRLKPKPIQLDHAFSLEPPGMTDDCLNQMLAEGTIRAWERRSDGEILVTPIDPVNFSNLTMRVETDEGRVKRLRQEGIDRLLELGRSTDLTFTCDHCGHADTCEYVFDPYNTDGDCLAEK